MNLNNFVKAAIFTATAIALGFVFMLIPNVEFISVTVFLSGLTLGFGFGAMVGGTSMFIYSTLNPLGSGLIYMPLLLGQVIAMSFIGVFGAITRRLLLNLSAKILIPITGAIGCLSAIWYDGLTTISYPIAAGYSWEEALAYSISGLIFTLMHVLSNTLIFSIVVPGYLRRSSL